MCKILHRWQRIHNNSAPTEISLLIFLPSDFWLFDYIKRQLTDHTNRKSLEKEITEILENIPKEEYQKTFNKWLERMELCIQNQGHYFEHLINK